MTKTSSLPPIQVLYEDNHLLVVEKPPGLATAGGKGIDTSLFSQCKEWLRIKYNKPGKVYLGLVHRLDRPTSGIVVFGKTSKGARRLSEQFRKGEIQKEYWALVAGVPSPKEGILEGYLEKIPWKGTWKARVWDHPHGGTKEASQSYALLKSKNQISLLLVKPKTGRFHQIRALLAYRGYPILGDIKYGGPSFPMKGGIGLQACKITLIHPTRKEILEFQTSYPQYWPLELKP
ncbi:MAG: RluA family pseudouridine synthase [Planctomycetota bacterium]|nr:MAG: RluA family pseudouridine synthase [Planctomycetota bacterium]